MEWSSFLSSPSQPEAPRGLMQTSGSRSFWNILWAHPDPGTQVEVGASFLCHHQGLRTVGPGLFLSGQPLGEGSGRGEESRGLGWTSVQQGAWPPRSGWVAGILVARVWAGSAGIAAWPWGVFLWLLM